MGNLGHNGYQIRVRPKGWMPNVIQHIGVSIFHNNILHILWANRGRPNVDYYDLISTHSVCMYVYYIYTHRHTDTHIHGSL